MSKENNKISLLLIIGIPIIGILLTTLYYFYVVNDGEQLGGHNQGMLISPPKQIDLLPLTMLGESYQWANKERKWTFLVVGSSSCDQTCADKLYLTRQIRAAMGKYQLRLENAYLSLDGHINEAAQAFFVQEHPKLRVINSVQSEVEQWAVNAEPALDMLSGANFYVVDPNGWVMMYYTDEQSYKEVIKDMKFLLKNS